MSVLKGKQFDLPIFFDLEERSQFNRGRSFGDSLVKAFCGELENNGWFAGIYISRSPLQNYISSSVAKRYALWIAEYGSKCNYCGDYGIWHRTNQFAVAHYLDVFTNCLIPQNHINQKQKNIQYPHNDLSLHT